MPMNPRLLRPTASGFNPRQISGLALWLDAADSSSLYTTDAGPGVTAVSSPLDISGCIGWYDSLDLTAMAQNSDGTGAVAVGDQVGWWKDKSATAAHVTQGTAENRPTLTANQVNGLAALKFDGSNDNLSSANYTAQNSLSGLTRILILQNATFAGGYITRVWNGGGDGLVVINAAIRQYVSADANYTLHATPSGSNALSLGIYSFRYGSSAMSLRSNGSGLSGTVNGTIPATTGAGTPALHIGSNIGANQFYNGVVAEYIIYNRELSAAELSRVEAYLAAKWGIAGVHAPATSASQPVGYWGDKSGNGRHVTQGTAASRPTISATALNGRKQLGLASQHLRGPSTTWTGSASIYWVGRTGQSSGGAMVFGDGTADQTDAFHAGWLNTAGVGAYGNGWSGGNAPRAESPLAWRNADILAGVTLSSAESLARVNGAPTSTTALTGTLSQASAAQFYIGRESASVWANLNGSLAEVLIYQPALNESQRLRIEHYLAAKWGITLAPQVSNADAQDWVNRVYANGGTVSAATANAVNTFCNDIDAAGIRDRFYRLNLFCGAGLNAALVPLYRGPTRTGTQYGNTTDTNNGPFVAGDYAETGASGGLKPNQSSKYLATGLLANALTQSGRHLSVWTDMETSVLNRFWFGTDQSGCGSAFWAIGTSSTTAAQFRAGTPGAGSIGSLSGKVHVLVSGNGTAESYVNGSASTTISGTAFVAPAQDVFIGALNRCGSPADFGASRFAAYSIGDSMSSAQALSFYQALAAFQTSLSRT